LGAEPDFSGFEAFMQANAIDHVSFWLDHNESQDAAFHQAMDWAFRLDLPLRITVTSTQLKNHRRNGAGHLGALDADARHLIEKLKTWGSACTQKRVVMETSFWHGGPEVAVKDFFRPLGLCICEDSPAAGDLPGEFFQRWLRNPQTLLLLCPQRPAPLTRLLAVYHESNQNSVYLQTITRMCQAMELEVIFLIVARSEREAQIERSFVEGACASLGMQAKFDSITGYDPRSAAAGVAGWRRCSHLIVEHTKVNSWWNRIRGNSLDQYRWLSDTLSVLAVPDGIRLEFPQKVKVSQALLAQY
jgi:hypothetical protein